MMKICFVAILASSVGLLLSELGFKGKRVYSAVAAVVLISLVGDGISEIVSGVTELSRLYGVSDVASSALKVLGCGYVFGMCSDICADLGEGAVARGVGIAGKIEIFVIVLPYLRESVMLGLELLG